jgi:hypothetical protein
MIHCESNDRLGMAGQRCLPASTNKCEDLRHTLVLVRHQLFSREANYEQKESPSKEQHRAIARLWSSGLWIYSFRCPLIVRYLTVLCRRTTGFVGYPEPPNGRSLQEHAEEG